MGMVRCFTHALPVAPAPVAPVEAVSHVTTLIDSAIEDIRHSIAPEPIEEPEEPDEPPSWEGVDVKEEYLPGESQPQTMAEKIFAHLHSVGGESNLSAICEATGLTNKASVGGKCHHLVKKGKLIRVKEGVFRLP